MTEARRAGGLEWRFAGDAWEAEDASGHFQVVEYRPGAWTALWFPRRAGPGCGQGAAGGADHDGFEAAVAAILRLAASRTA